MGPARYLPFAVNFVLILNEGDYGWPIRPIDHLSIFVSNKFIDLENPSSALVITSWALLFLVTIILSKNSSFIPFALKLSFLPIGLAVITYVYLIGGGNWGHDQNWKLLSYFIPFFLVIFYTSLAARKGVGRIILVPLLVMSLSAPYISWLPILKGQVPSNVLTRNQVNVLNSERLNILKFENISVSMPTWFETMAMANILENEHIYLISPSYLPILDPDPTHCVLEHISLTDSNKPFFVTDYRVSLPNGKRCD
jgi:general stress protein CsbA